jgi:hypothetical protein
MKLENVVSRLLEEADPSIRYRINREILLTPSDAQDMRALQSQIERKKKVRDVVSWPQETYFVDGWIGREIHGCWGFDTGLSILREQGLEADNPLLKRAKKALLVRGDNYDTDPFLHVGTVLDEEGHGGLRAVRAEVLSLLNGEEQAIVKEQINLSLEHFESALSVSSLDDISYAYTGAHKGFVGKRVYKKGAKFPGGWHLSILAFTHSWRTSHNLDNVAAAFNIIFRLMPIPPILVKSKAYPVGPAGISWDCLDTEDITTLTPIMLFKWVQQIQWIVRLGIIHNVPRQYAQVCQLRELLEGEAWMQTLKVHGVFKRVYGLENDWRSPRRKLNDLYFRFLMILHYSGLLEIQ